MSDPQIPTIMPADVREKKASFKLIDVRRPDEWTGELGHIAGATMSTLETDLTTFLDKLPKDETYVFVCRSGGRSGRATEMALQKGFKNVFNMVGGMIAWNDCKFEVEK